jgi:hypothetical protein
MRNKRTPLALAVVAVMVAVGAFIAQKGRTRSCTVPKSWGRAVAIGAAPPFATYVAFEDEAGVVRIVEANCDPGQDRHSIGRTDD